MTRDEIIKQWNAKSPRERDTWVAEVVFKFEKIHLEQKYWDNRPLRMDFVGTRGLLIERVPHYTEDIAAAWEVLDAVKDKMYTVENYTTVRFANLEYFNGEWTVKIQGPIPSDTGGICTAESKSAPEAICLAALIAVLGE